MFNFSRNLNLLIDDDLSTFFQECKSLGYPLDVSSVDELREFIHFGSGFLPDSAFAISAGMTPIGVKPMAQIRAGIAYSFVKDILPIICFLYTLKDDNDFINKVKTNLANMPQFDDTFFELKCLNHFHRNSFSFQYEPKVYDKGKEKNPDFRLTKDDIELFCECKQVRIGQNKAELQFNKQCDYVRDKFNKELELQLFDKKLRLEVNFKGNPSPVDLDELARQIIQSSSQTKGFGELPLQQVGESIEYLVTPQSEPSQFSIRTMITVSMRFSAGKPRRLWNPATNSPEGEIVFYSTDLARRRAETLRRDIKRAKNQLPDDKFGIIIINRAKLTIAKQAIERRMNGRQYDNIIAFVVNPFNDFWTCYRTHYRELLFNLFEGFQHENPFKSN